MRPDIGELALAHDPLQERRFTLSLCAGWTDAYAQSAHLLREEMLAWQATSWSLALAEP